MPYICDCGRPFDLIAALDGLPSDRIGSSGMFSPACSGCGRDMEIRLKNGGFDVGYSYFGGSMHFEPVKRVRVSGLKITPSDPDDLTVTLGDRLWRFAVRQTSSSRFCVLPGAYAAGKRVGELDFGQWGVSLTGMERDHNRMVYCPDTVIMQDDFLWITGPAPALTRAWHYMNDGLT